MPRIRPPIAAEIVLLGRAILPLPAALRRQVAEAIVDESRQAAAHLCHFGAVHPEYGDGSLMSRILPLDPVPEPFADNLDFLHALAVAVATLLIHYKTTSPSPHFEGRQPQVMC